MASNRFISFFREFIYNAYTRAALSLTFQKKIWTTQGGHFCCRLLPEHFGVRRSSLTAAHQNVGTALSLKSKAGMISQLTTGRRPSGSQ